MMAYKKLMKGIDDERKLAERLTNELLPEVEKEEQVSSKMVLRSQN